MSSNLNSMETGRQKRPAPAPEQSLDTFAVCTNCSRLSCNLRNCDKCGSPLSEDNAALCFGNEPKRACLGAGGEPSPSLGSSVVNGSANGPSSDGLSDSNSPVLPVPQALYVNKNTINNPAVENGSAASAPTTPASSASDNSNPVSATPQALYINFHNQTSGLNVTQVRPAGAKALPSVPVSSPATSVAPTQGALAGASDGLSTTARPAPPVISAGLPAPPPLLGTSLTTSVTTQQSAVAPAMLTVVNQRRTPVTPSTSLTSSSQLGAVSVSMVPGPVTIAQSQVRPIGNVFQPAARQPPPYPSINPPRASSVWSMPTTAVVSPQVAPQPDSFSVEADQIRIGAKKFLPISPVAFKDDGILFTLKGYTYAPLLLNARAILKCRANLHSLVYPIVFLYLEASCMRQIRNIFKINDEDFTIDSDRNLNRCITLFLKIIPAQFPSFCKGVREAFHIMKTKYARQKPILEEVSLQTIVDCLLDSYDSIPDKHSAPNTNSAPAVSRTLPLVTQDALTNVARTPTNSNQIASSPAGSTAQQLVLQPQAASEVLRAMVGQTNMTTTTPSPAASRQSSIAASTASRSASVAGGARSTGGTALITSTTALQSIARSDPSSPPMLVVPSDNARWVNMQKSLIVGGVYHAQMPNGTRKYCLWNGSALVPCLVQNTEVQLFCLHIRIGSLRTRPVGPVRIKADTPSGIAFKFTSKHCGEQDVLLLHDDMTKCLVCFDTVTVIFIQTTANQTQKFCNDFKLLKRKDPTYDPLSKEESQKFIILFIQNLTQDQKGALMQMRQSSTPNKTLLQEIDVLRAIHILNRIKEKTQGKANTGSVPTLTRGNAGSKLEKIVKELSVMDNTRDTTVEEDDDDDDVIMMSEEIGVKCPYTQQVMKFPVKNRICGHNYEKSAIMEFILRKKGNARCPYAGCGNTVSLRMEDITDNKQLKDYIEQKTKEGTLPTTTS